MSPQAVGYKSTKSGAQIFTLMFLSSGKLKDPPGFPGLGAELSIGKYKPQEHVQALFVALLISSVQAEQRRGDTTVPPAKPRAEIAKHVLR